MRFYNYPFVAKFFFKDAVFNTDKNVFLTIDDCSDAYISCFIAGLLNKLAVKATFFCSGKFLTEDLINCLKKNGHSLGNHTFSHLNGFEVNTEKYISDVKKFDTLYKTKLFRPPFGKITLKQYKKILHLNKDVIFWNLMTYDFDTSISTDFILDNALKKTKNGTIIVFHSNEKTKDFIAYLLKNYVSSVKKCGLTFDFFKER